MTLNHHVRACFIGAMAFFCAVPLTLRGQDALNAHPKPFVRKILAGDSLRVTVEEEPSLSRLYAVAGDGTIDFGYAGRVEVAEQTEEEAAVTLEQVLVKLYFKEAHVTVQVAEFVEGAILIQGAVERPGSIPFRGDQIMSLVEAISQAGGLTREAAGNKVRILRLKPGAGMEREIITVDVQSMNETLDFSKDQFLRPRDMIIVPSLGEQTNTQEYLVLGEFGAPGFHPYTPGLNMIRALTRAGGVGREAKLDSARLLRANAAGVYSAIPIDLSRLFGAADMSMNVPVLAGDIIFVPSAAQATRGQIYLLGEVARPGSLQLPLDKDITVAKTILESGGFSQYANQSKVKVLRSMPDGSKQTLIVDVGRILKNGSFEDDVPLDNGDVIIVPEKTLGL